LSRSNRAIALSSSMIRILLVIYFAALPSMVAAVPLCPLCPL
jgi:hypothetical protein